MDTRSDYALPGGRSQPSPEDGGGAGSTEVPASRGGAGVSVLWSPVQLRRRRSRAEDLSRPPLPSTRDAVFRRLLAAADLIAAAGALAVLSSVTGHNPRWLAAVTLPLILVLAKITGRYDHDELVLRKSTLDEVPRLLSLAAGFALAWSVIAFFGDVQLPLRGEGVAVLWASAAVFLIAARTTARAVARVSAPPERTLIVGSSRARLQLGQSLRSDPGARMEIVGFLPLEDERRRQEDWGERSRRLRQLSFEDLGKIVRELHVDRVFLIPTSADNETMLDAVSSTTALGVKVSIVPRLLEVVGSAVEFDSVGGVTVLGVRRPGLTRSSRAVKRAIDLAGAGIGLALLAPFGALVAAAIKLDSSGPVFFRQRRVGRDGHVFEMFKFRSMFDGAEAHREALAELNETGGLFKIGSDPRITRIGKWLRRASLDELPQLINVMRGEMSLVGPRPLVLDEDRLVEGRHRGRLTLAPGMTGPWQVLGPRRPPLSEMVKTDYLYAATWSLWGDLKIMLRTLGHVVARRGL
jgi:exopolysaccharide biosynthesis polyprenyl glycosylphosphotransferase